MKAVLASFCIVLITGCAVCFLLNSGQIIARNHYDRGFQAGGRVGFEKGYIDCYNSLGMHWLGSYDRFREFSAEYGNLHNTPWGLLTIEEKVTIAMYGGSGSKLEPEEIEEWAGKYGR